MNPVGDEAYPPTLQATHTLPWVQDTAAQRAWIGWAVRNRDLIITDAFNRPIARDNLTDHDLFLETNRSNLTAILLKAVVPVDSDHDQLPDDWEYGWFGNLTPTGTDDPDHDGVDNFSEFAFVSNPTDPKSVPGVMPVFTPSTNGPIFGAAFRRFTGHAVEFVMESSGDLVTWTRSEAELQAPLFSPLYDGFGGGILRLDQTSGASLRPTGFIRVRPVPRLSVGSPP